MLATALLAVLTVAGSTSAQEGTGSGFCGPFQLSGSQGAGKISPEGVVTAGGDDDEFENVELLISSNGTLRNSDTSLCVFERKCMNLIF